MHWPSIACNIKKNSTFTELNDIVFTNNNRDAHKLKVAAGDVLVRNIDFASLVCLWKRCTYINVFKSLTTISTKINDGPPS